MGQPDNQQSAEKMSRLAMLWGEALPSVSTFVRSVVRNPHDADDVIQATVSYLAQHFDDYDPKTPFIAWAIKVSRYRIMEQRHQNTRQPLLLGDEALASLSCVMAEESAYQQDRLHALEHCMGRLSTHHQQVLANRYYEHQSREEIAEAMSIKVNSVSVMLFRIRQVLHECINNRLGGASQ